MQNLKKKILFYFFTFYLIVCSVYINPSTTNKNFPVIDLVRVPSRVEVGKYFTVAIKVKSQYPIVFFNVFLEDKYNKIPAKRLSTGVYSISLIVKKPGIKKMRTFAIDSRNFSGKTYNSTFYAYSKINGLSNSEIGFQYQTPQKPVNVKAQSYKFMGAPPEIDLDKYIYCNNEKVLVHGKNFTKDIKARIGVTKFEVTNIKTESLEIITDGNPVSDYLYLKSNFGETKSDYKLIIGGIPEIRKIDPVPTGQNELLEITGKNLSEVNQAALRIKSIYVDEVFYLKIIGKPEKTILKTRMPSVLHYPGKASIDLHSRCGYGKEFEIDIARSKVTILRPQFKKLSNNYAAPGSTVYIYLDKISIPDKKEFKVTFNFLEGEIKKLKYSKTDKYKLTVLIPENVDNIVGYNQKVRIYAFGHEIVSKDSFYFYGRPEVTGINIASWSDKFVEIDGHNFKKDHTEIYFSGPSGTWIASDQVNYLGFDKVAAKIPFNAVKGRIKIKTFINGIWQEQTSTIIFDPDPEPETSSD